MRPPATPPGFAARGAAGDGGDRLLCRDPARPGRLRRVGRFAAVRVRRSSGVGVGSSSGWAAELSGVDGARPLVVPLPHPCAALAAPLRGLCDGAGAEHDLGHSRLQWLLGDTPADGGGGWRRRHSRRLRGFVYWHHPASGETTFLCPITHDAMRSPVMGASGVTYERAAAEAWVKHPQCVDGVGLMGAAARDVPGGLFPNRALRDMIEQWHERGGRPRQRGRGRALSPRPKAAVSPRPKVAVSPRPKVAVSPRPKVAVSPRPKVAVSPRPKVA
eukprot:gene38140-50460_t